MSSLRRALARAALGLAVFPGPAVAAELTLRDASLLSTPTGRGELKYLVGCAMPADDTVAGEFDGRRYVFKGGMGLAPAWAKRALDPQEQRLLSACMLARTNRFGVPVMLSLRSFVPHAPASLQADADERREFPFYEGAFFGNLFQPNAVGYVCGGAQGRAAEAHLRRVLRVCTLPGAQEGKRDGLTRCRFRHVGACSAQPWVQDGVDYRDTAIHIYLPGAP